jgi:hypothetical protein
MVSWLGAPCESRPAGARTPAPTDPRSRVGLGKSQFKKIAFIKKRCIHDDFMYVSQVVKDLYKIKIPSLFMKLDISKAFDSINWPFLRGIMNHLGFGFRCTNWISSLWCTASSCYSLNGQLGRRVIHCIEVRQWDPLSPMLFLLAMEPLHRLFKRAQDIGLLKQLSSGCDASRASLYADDDALFINPTINDLQVTISILSIFLVVSIQI